MPVGAITWTTLTENLGTSIESGVSTALPIAAIILGATVVFRVIKRFVS